MTTFGYLILGILVLAGIVAWVVSDRLRGRQPMPRFRSARNALCQRRRRAEYARTAVELLESHSAEAGVRLAYLLNDAVEVKCLAYVQRCFGAQLTRPPSGNGPEEEGAAILRISAEARPGTPKMV